MNKFPRFFIILTIAFITLACKQFSISETIDLANNQNNTLTEGNFIINGTAYTPDDQTVYLFESNANTYKLVDSTTVNNTKFQFNGGVNFPKRYRVSLLNNKNKGFTFLVDNSEIHVFLNRRIDFASSYSSSTIQKEYNAYTSQMNTFKDQGMGLYYGLKGDFSSENIEKLKRGRLSLFSKQGAYAKDFIKKHPNSRFSVMLIKDHIKTFDKATLNTLFHSLSPEIQNLAQAQTIDALINGTKQNVKNTATITPKTKVIPETKSIVKTKPKTTVTPETEYRPKAYALSGSNPYGETISLNSIPKGKVILVDFWASWCGPCRATNPSLVKLYEKYNSQGFEILSVSEDRTEGPWLNAIDTDQLTWDYHIIDTNKNLAFRYGVESIPFKLLIDKNGNIASSKVSGNTLESKIIQLLNE